MTNQAAEITVAAEVHDPQSHSGEPAANGDRGRQASPGYERPQKLLLQCLQREQHARRGRAQSRRQPRIGSFSTVRETWM